ncbi:MAG: NAD-dependent epimerase/dehydratase family protein [Magnetococcales bacterium]|nr:NAD-dependent epimerase/dehydratase family protein [Magnetococcales bacterium]
MTAQAATQGTAQSFEGKRVLITGGLGFIGSNLAVRLVQEGAKVTLIDSLVPAFGGNPFNIEPIRDRVTLNISDLRDPHSLRILVREQEIIFHLAAQVSHGDSMREPDHDLANNATATLNLMEACRECNPHTRLVYTSTRQVYGIPRELPVTEDHPALPIDINGIHKLAAEYYHLLYHRTYGIPSTILRLTNTYGPRLQIKNDRQGFIGVFLRRALLGQTLNIFGDGQQIRDFNHVDDVVEALLLAAQNDDCMGQFFNLGAATPCSLLTFAEILSRHTPSDYRLMPFPEDSKLIDIGDYYGDYGRFSQTTGWQPRVGLEEGLESTVAWFRQHGKHYL